MKKAFKMLFSVAGLTLAAAPAWAAEATGEAQAAPPEKPAEIRDAARTQVKAAVETAKSTPAARNASKTLRAMKFEDPAAREMAQALLEEHFEALAAWHQENDRGYRSRYNTHASANPATSGPPGTRDVLLRCD